MRKGLFDNLSCIGGLGVGEKKGGMTCVTLLELARTSRLGFPEVEITRFLVAIHNAGDSGAIEVESSGNLVVRLTGSFQLDDANHLAKGGIDHSIKE
jgi:hypothetical protein